jgi:DNA helicase-2/ATP-dependent DNA helicase PcrA
MTSDRDPAIEEIPAEEEALLQRVQRSLAARRGAVRASERARYDADLVAMRDEIGEARLEDVAALVAQMERLQGISLRRAEAQGVLVDPGQPYFGHMRLREVREAPGGRPRERVRDVLIGRATFVDPEHEISIVDWRHAPVSQLYYRYGEGSDYNEEFGDQEVEGEVLVRRTVTIEPGSDGAPELTRIAAPQGIFVKHGGVADQRWQHTPVQEHELAGGQGTASRPPVATPVSVKAERGKLGIAEVAGAGGKAQRLDRHLPEIAALIDKRQFELITAPSSGVVVIQGGAGSGKTTIGLHRMAYLAYAAPNRFVPKRMLVVTYGSALAAYISEVLPALGVAGVRVVTFESWATKELSRAIPWLRVTIADEAPPSVSRVKSHPAVLRELERRAKAYRAQKAKRSGKAVVELWAELLTDQARLLELCCADAEAPLPRHDVIEAHRLMAERVAALIDREAPAKPPETSDDDGKRKKKGRGKGGRRDRAADRRYAEKIAERDDQASAEIAVGLAVGSSRIVREQGQLFDRGDYTGRNDPGDLGGLRDSGDDGEAEDEGDEIVRGATGIDGLATAGEGPVLDLADAAMLIRANQLLRGSRKQLSHLFIDEAQDLSPVELAALIGETTDDRSVTLAGDTSQRLFLDNGFRDWRTVLKELGLDHVAVEPLRISYRSTREILQLARFAMGPLADPDPPFAPRSGAPVEAHRFPAAGAAVAFLADALRPLLVREPRATVAILARHPEQADRYYDGLARAEIPSLRRVRVQDFSFRPGVEVTEIRQVKGLEFDYVILVDVNATSFGTDDESRHLFHIAATRAAHQLWLIVTGAPSPLFPPQLLP